MRALTPWTGMPSLKQEMDRLFERFFEPGDRELAALGDWVPTLDVSETKDAIVIKAEVPAVDPKDIQVAIKDQVLIIKGEKKDEREEKEEHYYRVERSYGAFSRSVRLPAPVDESKVSATFKNGLLTVTMGKTAAAKGTTIPIKAA